MAEAERYPLVKVIEASDTKRAEFIYHYPSKEKVSEFFNNLRTEYEEVPIKDWEGYYSIGNDGKIISESRLVICGNRFGTKSERLLKRREKKPFKTKTGYWIIELKREGFSKKYLRSRLVAQHFIPNPENKPEVNHKNCNKDIDAVWNLEWSTKAENEEHAKINGRKNLGGRKHNG